ncbi:unnamed protein product [Leptidea sinapis]|uniref:Acyl-coenzyme A oxidase n=2 Tax=Leptidea sinapis TaxID=189913 RepID=A0A5E4QDR4_9NEOP|nr:unnamed protein product [Leptidea sinapis]
MTLVKINPDLQKERDSCTFNTEELTNFFDAGDKYTRKRRELENKIFSIKELKDEIPDEYLSHKEKYENALRKAVLLLKAMKKIGYSRNFEDVHKSSFRESVHTGIFKDGSPFMLQYSMFIPTLQGMADEEQKRRWLNRAMNFEIIGTYAQTELGHGTFIRGLETQAIYNEKTEEFILHSPTLTAYKWWPGGLAHTANYCIVMAQLIIKGKNHGMQPFIVQIRDEETHMPLPGIKVGEIGPKLTFSGVNNGFLGFEHVRIPRENMLMKYNQDGTFKSNPNSKLTYGTMVYVRVTIVFGAATQLARAVTIAVRYSAVRRQSRPKPNEPEPQILDYATQQHKLFIGIATSHAYTLLAYWLWDIYTSFKKDLESGNLDRLPELHSLACVLKVVSSKDCTRLVEQCRMSCGGHGFMMSSSLPQIYGLATAACTYEGENTVSLVKALDQATKGKPLSPTMAYLGERSVTTKWENSVDGIVKSFQKVSIGKLRAAVSSLKQYERSGLSPEDAWNKSSVQLISAAEAHGRAVVMSVYKSETDKYASTVSAGLKTVLYQLVELYAIYMVLQKMGDMLLYGNLTEADVTVLQRRYEELLELLRPNAVGLVDAFDFRDEVLSSTLGSYDGFAYERLMEEAMKSPLNAEPVNQSFEKYMKPLMKGKL